MIVLMAFCTLSVGLRTMVRTYMVKAFGLDDIGVLIAYVSIPTLHHHLVIASSFPSFPCHMQKSVLTLTMSSDLAWLHAWLWLWLHCHLLWPRC